MLIPLSWIKDYLDLNISEQKIADTLTLAGLEVDKIEKSALGFSGIVVAKILQTSPHPEADRLRVAEVTDGTESFQVVCGAENCREGLTTAFARVGARLTDETGKDFKIKKSKLRGVESFGMLCAEEELGLSSNSTGIMELDDSLPVGTELTSIYGDTIFEISLTPNLGHCTSVRGIARELAALLNLKLKPKSFSINESKTLHIGNLLEASVESYKDCPRYSLRYIENVEVKTSPEWLRNRLESCGIRSINNIVDITNYVMLELGQPMHSFDYDKIEGSQLIVKLSEKKEQFQTLDEEKREVPENTLLIYDETKPLAVAGVIGGLSSSITESTTRIVLESAYFNPSTIRKSSKSLNLRTDSSSRFEKTTDPNATLEALNYATSLIIQTAGGNVASDIIDEKQTSFPSKKLTLRLSRVNKLLGSQFSLNEVAEIFSCLDFSPQILESEELIEVEIPTYRNDIKEEIDLIEEVARIYGYNNIPYSKPKCHISTLDHSPLYLTEKDVREKLISQGLQECITCNLISPKLAKLGLKDSHTQNSLLEVLQPSSVDQSILRPSLLPSLLQMVKHNFDRQTFSISAFEVGLIHFNNKGPKEKASAGIILTGSSQPDFWGEKPRDYDYFDLKGILENVFISLGIEDTCFTSSNLEGFHPGRRTRIETKESFLGYAGEVHPKVLKQLDINQRVYFAELDLQELFKAKTNIQKFQPLPQYPGSERDWTKTFKTTATVETILKTLQTIPSRLLKEVSLIDLYTSPNLGEDKKNLTFRFQYRDDKKTVEFETVEKEHHRILSTAESKLKDLIS